MFLVHIHSLIFWVFKIEHFILSDGTVVHFNCFCQILRASWGFADRFFVRDKKHKIKTQPLGEVLKGAVKTLPESYLIPYVCKRINKDEDATLGKEKKLYDFMNLNKILIRIDSLRTSFVLYSVILACLRQFKYT